MKNQWLRKAMIILTLGCLTFSMTACKAEHVLDKVLEKTDSQKTEEDKTEETESTEPRVEVAKPELTTNLSGSVTYKKGDQAEPLTVEATSSDGGAITYQWYKSLTNTNGGGTVIKGETKNTFTPPTEGEGTMYYYAVAVSTVGNSTNRVTSDTKEVIVTADAEAQSAEGNQTEGTKAEESKTDEVKTEENKTEDKSAEQDQDNKAAEEQSAQ